MPMDKGGSLENVSYVSFSSLSRVQQATHNARFRDRARPRKSLSSSDSLFLSRSFVCLCARLRGTGNGADLALALCWRSVAVPLAPEESARERARFGPPSRVRDPNVAVVVDRRGVLWRWGSASSPSRSRTADRRRSRAGQGRPRGKKSGFLPSITRRGQRRGVKCRAAKPRATPRDKTTRKAADAPNKKTRNTYRLV